MSDNGQFVPRSLKNWFIVHCIVDLVFALPLLFFPKLFLSRLGWPYYDPMTCRIVAAALIGIGLESYLGRNASRDMYAGMLRLKIIWSLSATVGILTAMFSVEERPIIGLLLALVFAAFNALWVFWWMKLRTPEVK